MPQNDRAFTRAIRVHMKVTGENYTTARNAILATDDRQVWPSTEQYILAAPCPTCRVPAGAECDAPRRKATRKRQNALMEALGQPLIDTPIFHARRQDAGIHHYGRDVGKAPWVDDREPGRCYCTITPCPLTL